MKSFVSAGLLMYFFGSGTVAAQKLALGDPAPELRLQAVLGAPSPPALSDLRGRVVVLEFWATWCGASRAAIPHLNALAEELAGEPVAFLAVTTEPEGVVRAFLENQPFRLPVALDDQGKTSDAFGATWFPKVVVLDQEGVVRGITAPSDLTAESLRSLVNGSVPECFGDRVFPSGPLGLRPAAER